MWKNIFYTLLIITIISCNSYAQIDIVYPTQKEKTVNAPYTFFLGNTDKNAELFINSKPVKLWENNFFVHVVPLVYGRNEIKFVEKYNGKTEQTTYYIQRNKGGYSGAKNSPTSYSSFSTLMYAKTVNENSTVREKPSKSANRVIELPPNVDLYLTAKQGDYYKISESYNTDLWIHKSNINGPVSVTQKSEAVISDIKVYSDEFYNYIKFYLTNPVPFTLKHNNNSIELNLLGIKKTDENGLILPNYKYTYTTYAEIVGYDCIYDGNNLLFRVAKVPELKDVNQPLKGVNIFIDAGHGGTEKGSVGPTRVKEKDVNLAISTYLAEYLQQSGANVSMSRQNDTQVGLYERVKMAKNNNAFLSLSIHSNALPDGKDPYVSHGCEVYYYNDNAKKLAEIINTNLAKDLNIKDNGVHRSSFALNRSTNPVSVLVEVAYMIHPEEYILLKNPQMQKKAALSIKNSIEKYMMSIQN